MGIHPDVLLEARVMARRRRREAGRQPPKGAKRAGTAHPQLEVLLPIEVDQLWRAEAESRGVAGATLLRSLVHSYLLGSFEPDFVLATWQINGQIYSLPNVHEWKRKHGSRYPYRERCLVPPGAMRALDRRASGLGVRRTSLARTLMILAIERRWGHQGTLQYVMAANMYDDENRYHLG